MRNRTEDQIEIRRNTGADTQTEIRLTLIRHGTTLSNKEGRYLGKTDEALSPDGIGDWKNPWQTGSTQLPTSCFPVP